MHFFVDFFWQRVGVGNVLLWCLLFYKQEALFLNKCLHVTLALEQVFHEAVTKGFLSITTLQAAETNSAGSRSFRLVCHCLSLLPHISASGSGIFSLTNSVFLALTPVDFCLRFRQPNISLLVPSKCWIDD